MLAASELSLSSVEIEASFVPCESTKKKKKSEKMANIQK